MPVNRSIKTVPDEIVGQLRARAMRHHRSLPGELMAILEAAVVPMAPLTVDQALQEVRSLEIASGEDSAAWIRADRDGRIVASQQKLWSSQDFDTDDRQRLAE